MLATHEMKQANPHGKQWQTFKKSQFQASCFIC